MSTSELKVKLKSLGINTMDCFEKSDLRSRLREAQISTELKPNLFKDMLKAGGVQLTLIRLRAKEGSLGSDIQIDDKSYYAVKLRVIDDRGRNLWVYKERFLR